MLASCWSAAGNHLRQDALRFWGANQRSPAYSLLRPVSLGREIRHEAGATSQPHKGRDYFASGIILIMVAVPVAHCLANPLIDFRHRPCRGSIRELDRLREHAAPHQRVQMRSTKTAQSTYLREAYESRGFVGSWHLNTQLGSPSACLHALHCSRLQNRAFKHLVSRLAAGLNGSVFELCLQCLQIVGPALHHFAALSEMLRPVVGPPPAGPSTRCASWCSI